MARVQPQQAIDCVTVDVPKTFGDRLICLALYGSAVHQGFIQGRSDLNFAIILQRVTQEDLEALHKLLPAWHQLGVATPLVIDLDFLEHARDLVTGAGGRIAHVDCTIICERPKIGPHRDAMRARIAGLLRLSRSRVSIKATTNEHMGFIGREEGIAAMAVASVDLS